VYGRFPFFLRALLVRRSTGFVIFPHQSLSHYTKEEMKYVSWKQHESEEEYCLAVNVFKI
jgi:hypothetical protein